MNYIILLSGAAILVSGIIITINPEPIFGLMRRKSDALSFHILAVVVRIILGVLLIYYAPETKYPTVILILGWLSIAAAIALSVIGRTNFIRLISWALGFSNPFGRIGGLFAILFGGFLIHAVV